jgi:hypothetical protein
LLASVSIFLFCFQREYVAWLYPTFEYYGFDYYPPQMIYLVLAWTLSLIPTLWMPLDLRRPSQLAYWFIYLIVYLPSMFIPLFTGLTISYRTAMLMFVMFLGLAIIGSCYLFRVSGFKKPNYLPRRFWAAFGIFSAALGVWVILGFHGHLQFVSFADIYDVRLDSADVMHGTLLNYPVMWLYGAINPFIVGWGLFRRKVFPVLLGVAGQLLIYGTLGTKASLLSIVFIISIYFMLRRHGRGFGLKLACGAAALYVLVTIWQVWAGEEMGLIGSTILFLIVFRTFGLAGLLSSQYLYFFQQNPYTYYSHIIPIRWLIHYPYDYPLGTVVGYFYYYPLVDTTAHFWATDGIAAAGLPGIIIASVCCAFVFWLLDSSGRHHDPRLGALVTCYAAYNLANLSLFTTFLSGGFGLLIAFLYILPTEATHQRVGRTDRSHKRGGVFAATVPEPRRS